MRLLEKMNFISTAMMDSITLMMIGSKLIGLKLRGSVFAPFLWNAVMLANFQADGR